MRRKIVSFFISFAILLSLGLNFDSPILADSFTVVINEVCSSNKGGNNNLVDQKELNGSYCDWIELYNYGSSAVNLGGFGVSDKELNPFKATLPANTTIAAQSFKIIYFAKDYNGDLNLLNVPFGISKDGETLILTSADSAFSQKVTIPALKDDTTYGRQPDGSSSFAVMNPTPNKSNNLSLINPAKPIFSHQTGFFENSFNLTLNAQTNNTQILYTTDGSDPKSSQTAIEYKVPITIKDRKSDKNILSAVPVKEISNSPGNATAPTDSAVDKATIIRAVCKTADNKFSKTVTATYFVGTAFSTYKDSSIISMSTDYQNLFDDEIGIYSNGNIFKQHVEAFPNDPISTSTPTNYQMTSKYWERPCNIEYINNRESKISQDCGVRIQGKASRNYLQKGLKFYARSEYGDNYFNYPFFNEKSEVTGNKIKKYNSLLLRNGGNDNPYTKFTDLFVQNKLNNQSFTTQKGELCILFINGEYWGAYSFQPNFDGEYFEEKYEVEKENVATIKNDYIDDGNYQDELAYNDMVDFIANNDMSIVSNYQKANSLLDTDSFARYMVSQMYIANNDWPSNNTLIWRSRKLNTNSPYADGKWRMALMDTDMTLNLQNNQFTQPTAETFKNVIDSPYSSISRLLKSLLKNQEFKQICANVICEIANLNFNSQKSVKDYTNYYETWLPQLTKTINRFNDTTSNQIKDRFEQGKDFLARRLGFALNHFAKAVGISTTTQNLNLSSNLEDAATYSLNNSSPFALVDFSNNLSLSYYSQYPITITAQEKEGYKFKGWSGSLSSANKTITLTLDSAKNLVANFEKTEVVEPTTTNTADPTISTTTIFTSSSTTKATVITSTTNQTQTTLTTIPAQSQTFPSTQSTTNPSPNLLIGDANSDGVINSKDVLLIRRILAGYNVVINETNGDVNKDKKVNAKDILLIRKYLAGIIIAFE